MKKLWLFMLSITFILYGCLNDPSKLIVSEQNLGEVKEGVLYPFETMVAPSSRSIGFDVSFKNNTGKARNVIAIWSYRENGNFREIMKTEKTVKKGNDSLIFPFTSSKDLFLGEYMVELYIGDVLKAAQRFYVVSDGKEKRDDIGMLELSKCFTFTKQSLCKAQQECTATVYNMDDKSTWVCEPR